MRRLSRRIQVLLLASVVGGSAVGCYKHTIRTEGIGVHDPDVYEPNRGEPDLIDDAMWGEQPDKK